MRIDSAAGAETEERSVDVENDTWVPVTKVWNLGHIRTGLADILAFRDILLNDLKETSNSFFTSKTSKRLKYLKGIKWYDILVWWGLKNFFILKIVQSLYRLK